MARFIDFLRRQNKVHPILQRDDVIVVAADNVAQYLTDEQQLDLEQLFKLPCVVPPFNWTFIEWRDQKAIEGNGYLAARFDLRDKQRDLMPGWTAKDWQYLDDLEVRFIVTFAYFSEKNPLPRKPVATVFLSETGSLMTPYDGFPYLVDADTFLPKIAPEGKKIVLPRLHIALWTLQFLNTQKVEKIEVSPPEKLNKKHQKRHKAPLTKYYTLKVTAVNGRPERREHQGGHHKSPAQHIVRGRFRTYGDDAPLFGKWTGTWWWAEYERGKKAEGQVIKDYEVVVNEDD